MKKYLILMLCLLSLRGTAQNRYEDLGNGTVLVHRNIPSSTSSSKNTKVTSVQHLHFQGISLNTSFRDFLKYLRAKHFYVDVRVMSLIIAIYRGLYAVSRISTYLLWETTVMMA